MTNERSPQEQTENSLEAAEDAALREVENLRREERWGGVEALPYKKEHTVDGVVPHDLFAKKMEEMGMSSKEKPLLESEEWSPERTALAAKVHELFLSLQNNKEQQFASYDKAKKETDKLAEEAAISAVTTLLDEALYLSVVTELSDEVYQQILEYRGVLYTTNAAGNAVYSQARPVEVLKTDYEAKAGIVHIQVGPYTSDHGKYEGGIGKTAKQVSQDGLTDQREIKNDELICIVNEYGDTLHPDKLSEDPQTVQINDVNHEITVRADRVKIIVLQHKGEFEYWGDGFMHHRDVDKLVVIASPEMEDRINRRALEYVIANLELLTNGEFPHFIRDSESRKYFDRLRAGTRDKPINLQIMSQAVKDAEALLQ